jgi:acyl-ACP thioesterase
MTAAIYVKKHTETNMTTIQTIWTEALEVHTHETDAFLRCKPAAYLRMMEEATTHHSRNLGVDYFTLQKNNLAWILARTKIKFYQFPSMITPVQVQTWPKGWAQKIFGMRDFTIKTSDGQLLAQATTAWLLVNTQTHRFVKPEVLTTTLPDNDGLAAIDEPLEKLSSNAELQEKRVFQASYSCLDVMGHVNNTQYVDWIMDCFAVEDLRHKQMDWLQINYSNEVKPDQRVSVRMGSIPNQPHVYAVAGSNLDTGAVAFEAQFAFKPSPA